MKKQFFNITVFGLLLFVSQMIGAQATIENPSITPVAPESAGLGRYGDVALTGATGQMSYSVPIYNIQVDGNSWPISLNYSYNGLILEGKPSLSGLGWNLSAYGSITKETRGLPDGHTNGYYRDHVRSAVDAIVTDYEPYSSNPDGEFEQTPFDDLNKFLTSQWDSEVDKYTVSVGGIRFSFKIKKDSNGDPEVYYLSRHNYKVDVTKDNTKFFSMASFIVTDDSGVQYFFDADDSEIVFSDPYSEYAQDNTTSWLLSEIKYNNGQSIIFDYEKDQGYFSYDYVASGIENDALASEPGPTEVGIPVQNWAQGYGEEIRKSEIHRQILKTINFPQGSIHISNVGNAKKLFYKIELKDHTGSIVDTYDLEYGSNRDVLTKITKNGETFYDFEYYGVHTPGYMPEFIDDQQDVDKAWDQDYWRYYNAAGNTRSIHLPFTNELANKLPNFSAARTGALRRIIYPTGGYTEVNYEQNQVKVPYEDSPVANQTTGYNDELFVRVDTGYDNTNLTATITKTFTYPVRANLYHKLNGKVANGMHLSINVTNTSGDYSSCYYGAYTPISMSYYPLELQNAKTYLIEDPDLCAFYPYPIIMPTLVIDHDPGDSCSWYPGDGGDFSEAMGCTSDWDVDGYDDSGGDFFIVPGTYTFTVTVDGYVYGDSMAEIGLRWYDPAIDNGGTLPDYVNKNVGGIRVANISDYTDEGVRASIKHYEYEGDDGLSSGRLNQTPFFKNSHEWTHHMTGVAPYETWTQVKDEYLLNSYTALNVNHGIPVYYGQIKTYQGDANDPFGTSGTYPNGYTLQKFSLPNENLASDTYPNVPRQEDISKALSQDIFVKDDVESVISSQNNQYSSYRWNLQPSTDYDNSSAHPWSFKYYKKLVNFIEWDGCENCYNLPTGLGTAADNALKALHDIRFYKEVNLKRLPTTTTSISQGITSIQTLSYDSDLLLQSSITHDSSGEEIRVEYDYPSELTNESQYDDMVDLNYLSKPVVQRTYRNNVLVSQQKTNYESIYESSILVSARPKEIFSAKGSETLSKEIEFSYDSQGNITEYKRNNGLSPTTSFIWGYQSSVPVAKVDNATFAEASSNIAGGIGSIQNLDGQPLRDKLNAMSSALPNAQVTSYTYNPLIGVSSITNPNGQLIHYYYDDLNRLQYVKDKNLDVLKEYKYRYRLEPIQVVLNSSASNTYIGETISFNALPTGGSGNFSYKWTVSNTNLNNVTTTSSNDFDVLITSSHTDNFTLTCEITDTETNDSVLANKLIFVANTLPPFTVGNITKDIPNGSVDVNDTVKYTINVSGGSGNYNYQWSKSNTQGTTSYGTSSLNKLTLPVASADCSSFTISCIVTDTTTNNTETKQLNVFVDSGCSGGGNQ